MFISWDFSSFLAIIFTMFKNPYFGSNKDKDCQFDE